MFWAMQVVQKREDHSVKTEAAVAAGKDETIQFRTVL